MHESAAEKDDDARTRESRPDVDKLALPNDPETVARTEIGEPSLPRHGCRHEHDAVALGASRARCRRVSSAS